MSDQEIKVKKPQTEAQIRARKKYYEKMKQNEEFMERNRERSRKYIQDNRELFNERCKNYQREIYYPAHREQKIASVRRYQDSKKDITEDELYFPQIDEDIKKILISK